MKETYAKISNQETENASRGGRQYDEKVRSTIIKHGDLVSVHSLTLRGGLIKLSSFWKNEAYVVISRKSPDSEEYDIQLESQKKLRTTYRNMPFPCDYSTYNMCVSMLIYILTYS